MKFLTLCDDSGMIETELFAQQFRMYGLQTVRHPVLRITGKVVPCEIGRGHNLDIIKVESTSSP